MCFTGPHSVPHSTAYLPTGQRGQRAKETCPLRTSVSLYHSWGTRTLESPAHIVLRPLPGPLQTLPGLSPQEWTMLLVCLPLAKTVACGRHRGSLDVLNAMSAHRHWVQHGTGGGKRKGRGGVLGGGSMVQRLTSLKSLENSKFEYDLSGCCEGILVKGDA